MSKFNKKFYKINSFGEQLNLNKVFLSIHTNIRSEEKRLYGHNAKRERLRDLKLKNSLADMADDDEVPTE
jgi:hypothetical protein